MRNLSGMIPNFYMQEGGLKLSTPLYVRGIGTVSGTPPVGLYVDGVPVFDKNAFIFDLYDIKQIEVLRGPQTTLYGIDKYQNQSSRLEIYPTGKSRGFEL